MVDHNDGKDSIQSGGSGSESSEQAVEMVTEDSETPIDDHNLLLRAVLESPHSSPSVQRNYSSTSSNYYDPQRRDGFSQSGFDSSDEMSCSGNASLDSKPVLPEQKIDTGYRPIHRIGSAVTSRKINKMLAESRTSHWVYKTVNYYSKSDQRPSYNTFVLGNSSTFKETSKLKSPPPEHLGNRYREHTIWRTISSNLEAYYKEDHGWTPYVMDNHRLYMKGRSQSSDKNLNIDEENRKDNWKKESKFSNINWACSPSRKVMQLQVGKERMRVARRNGADRITSRRSNVPSVPNSQRSKSRDSQQRPTTYFLFPEVSPTRLRYSF